QARDGIFAQVAMNAVRRLAYRTFEHMHQLSLRFHLERKTGGLTRVLERGRNAIETIVRMVIMQLVPTIIELALILVVLLYQFDWRYVAVILGLVALYTAFTYQATEWRINIRRRMNDSDTDANVKAIDSLLNYETVKYFVAEEREAARYDHSMARYEEASVQAYVSLSVLNAGQATMFAILARDPEIEEKPGAKPLAIKRGAIRFENVSFAYDPGRQILKGVSFEVPAGHRVAVVGPSGAGKSTLSRLLFRFYEVSGGRILIDGQDIRDVTQKSLRSAIGMVPQDTVLFNDTIRYNIRYGRWDASNAEVEEAARLAQIDEFIRMSPK